MMDARLPGTALAALLLSSLALLARPAAAQDEMPALGGKEQKPIVAKPDSLTPNVDSGASSKAGTTIFGERESPIGLYITPWRDASAEKDIDRPARLLQEKPLPIDRTVFSRQVEYYNALTGELKKKGLVTPVSR